MYTGQTMCTHLRRNLQRKHHFAYTEACASARGDVYASAQKASAKASFCVYRSLRVCEGRCIRFCAESFSKNIILRIQMLRRLREAMYTHLRRNLQRKHHFAYTEAGASARGTVYASIQKPAAKSSFYVHIVSPLPGLPLHGLLCAGRLPSQTAACAVKEGILESLR